MQSDLQNFMAVVLTDYQFATTGYAIRFVQYRAESPKEVEEHFQDLSIEERKTYRIREILSVYALTPNELRERGWHTEDDLPEVRSVDEFERLFENKGSSPEVEQFII